MAKELAQISIFLAKPGETFESVLYTEKLPEPGDTFVTRSFDHGGATVQFLCEQSTVLVNQNPPWLDFVNEALEEPEQQIEFDTYLRRPLGLLLLEVNGRIFVATFGLGASKYVDKTKLLRDFGIKTAMNMCGNTELRQMKSRTHAIDTQHISRQLSRPSDTLSFGLGETELLQFISAHLEENSAITLQGKDSLTFKALKTERLSWDRLIDWCRRFLQDYESEAYKQQFPNYPNFQPATPEEVSSLDNLLVRHIKDNDLDCMHLAIPEFIGDDEFSFAYTNSQKRNNLVYSHIRIEDIHNEGIIKDLDKLDVAILKRRKIYAYSHEEDRILDYRKWSFYSCIVAELELGNDYFILSAGVWQKVDHDFTSSINEFVVDVLEQIEIDAAFHGIDLFSADRGQFREEVFNRTYCERNPNALLFDQAHLKIGDSQRNKEFCDILELREDEPMQIIHVKKGKGATDLSYLFMQGRLYCESFLIDDVFLTEIRQHITDSQHQLTQDFLNHIKEAQQDLNGNNFGVQFWLLYNEQEDPPNVAGLPLMAKYGIKLAYDSLRKIHKYASVKVAMVPTQMTRYICEKQPTEV